MAKILTIGEIMLEMSDIGDGLYRKNFAGDTFNVAYYIRAVSADAHEVDYLTALGADEESAQCLQFMQENGVGTSQCVRDPDKCIGLFLLANDAHGEKRYGYWRGQSAARYLFAEVRDLVGYDWICFSGITAAVLHHRENLIASIMRAKQHGARLVYDCNYRHLLWQAESARNFAESVFDQIDLVKISDEELALLFPEQTIESLSQSYPNSEWVLTCQAHKSEVWKNGTSLARQIFAAPKFTAVDTSGAGDAFLAAYLTVKLSGESREHALQKGHEIASQVVCVKGSIAEVKI